MLKFCFVPGTGANSTTAPPWWNTGSDQPSGAFASPNKSFNSYCYDTQEAWLDGEDDGFDGHINFELVPTNYQANVLAIMNIQYGAPHFYINSCIHGVPVGL